MSIEALILGKLHQPAELRTSKTGRQFVTCKVRAATGDDAAVFVNVVCFSKSAGAALLALAVGDSVALAGTLKPGAWTDRDGNARPTVDLVAAQVLTTYGLTKKRAAVRAAGEPAPDRTAAPAGPGHDHDDGADPWLNGGER